MNPFRSRAHFAALLALLCTSVVAEGTTVRPMNIIDLIDHSETIVAGRVETVSDGISAQGMPYTEVTLRIVDRLRGAPGETYTFRQFGLNAPRTMPDGKVYLGARPEGWPSFKVGETSLLFLYPKARVTGFQTTVGLGYGKLGMGNGVAVNAHDNAGLFANVEVDQARLSIAEQQMFNSRNGPVNAATLRTFIRRVVNQNLTARSRSHGNP
jgi:hypothetical protein